MERHSPVPWLTENRHLLPQSGIALDVACGRGRHALWLADQGFLVRAVDRDADAIALLNDEARRREAAIRASVMDLEGGDPELGIEHFDLIVAVNYLHRPLFPFLLTALRLQGVLVYETFTREQALRGKPTNPDYLLEPGELRRLVEPLSILASREGEDRGQFTASIVARKDGT